MMLNAESPPPAVAPAPADSLSDSLITASGVRFEIVSGDFASRVTGMQQRLRSGELRDAKAADAFVAEILAIPAKERAILRNWCVDRNTSILLWEFMVKLPTLQARQAVEAFYPGILRRAEALDSLTKEIDLRSGAGTQALRSFINTLPPDQRPLMPLSFSFAAKGIEIGENGSTRPKLADRIADRSGSERTGTDFEDSVLGIPFKEWETLLENDPTVLIRALNSQGAFSRALFVANWENRAWATTGQPGITLPQYLKSVFENDPTGAELEQTLHL